MLDDKDREIYRLQAEVAEWKGRARRAEKELKKLQHETDTGNLQTMIGELNNLRKEVKILRMECHRWRYYRQPLA